jgi:DNA polymerase III epsilon subunit-like protein
MIVIDLETTGLTPGINGILSIGAVDLNTGDEFYGECRVADHIVIHERALEVNGFTLAQVKDENKPTERELYHQYLRWTKGRDRTMAGHSVGKFDIQFLLEIHRQEGGDVGNFPFSKNSVDIHSIMFALSGGQSMKLKHICEYLGVDPEPDIHNALEGARAAARCFTVVLPLLKGVIPDQRLITQP